MLHRPIISIQLLLLAILFNLSCVTVPLPAPRVEQTRRINLIPCQFPNHKSELLCGKYGVYENRAAMSGRMITLNILVAPASSNSPRPDPIFFLAGGPGQGQARIASVTEDALVRALRRDRDLVFVDQRGTGDSHSLQCSLNTQRNDGQSYFAELFLPEQVRACQKLLAEKADLRYYTTPLAVDDLDEIRAALQLRENKSLRRLLRHSDRGRIPPALPRANQIANSRWRNVPGGKTAVTIRPGHGARHDTSAKRL